MIFNECPRDDWVRAAIEAGFNLVMLADPEAPADDLTRRVAELARLAHARGIAIEAELGELPCGASGGAPQGGSATDPDAAAAFVAATGVDLLAVSVGNVHIMTSGQAGLDLDRLAEIRRRVEIPLVLHGGTGIAADALREAIALGVAKVNYGTYLKRRYLDAVRSAIGVDAPTRTGCWASAGRKMSWSPAAGRSATPCSNGSISSAAAARPYNLRPSVSCACGYSATAEGSLMDVVMRLPDVATVDDTVTLVKWLVEVGRPVRRGDPLLEVETDKAILVVESPISGTLNAVAVERRRRGGHRTGHRDVRRRGGYLGRPGSAGGSATVPLADDASGPIAGAAGVVSGTAGLAAGAGDRSGTSPRSAGAGRSSRATARRRAQAGTAGST